MTTKTICLTESDNMALRHLLGSVDRNNPSFKKLREELEQAKVFADADLPADVVALNSRVTVLDMDDESQDEYVLVLPNNADPDRQRLSVLAPVATALLGYRVGEIVEWPMPGGIRRLKVLSVQREAID